ncbi:MAG: tetratricopeptide repeat protein [Methylophilaceae bacterium]|nr:tetratricopeptide repeat protein [Methyloradius sp.]
MPVLRVVLTALLLSLPLSAAFSPSASAAPADDLKEITQLANQGQQAAALTKVNNYLGDNPKDVQALFIKGVLLAELNKRDEAIKTFTDITAKYPNLPEPYNNLAVLYADQGQYDKARIALETAIKTHPSYATAHENLGDIYARMASEAYDKALQLDNSNARAQNKLSLIKELFSTTGKPIMLADNSKPADNIKPVIKPAEITKPVEPVKPTEAVKPADPVKPADTVKPAEAKPAEIIKPAEPAKPVVVEKPSAETSKPADKDGNEENNVLNAVKNWAKAWSNKNVDQYLASYGDGFQTPAGQSRKEWEASRRGIISKAAAINVEILNPRVILENANKAKVSFKQNYRAGAVTKRTSKTLVLQKVRNTWLIQQELTDR